MYGRLYLKALYADYRGRNLGRVRAHTYKHQITIIKSENKNALFPANSRLKPTTSELTNRKLELAGLSLGQRPRDWDYQTLIFSVQQISQTLESPLQSFNLKVRLHYK